jgi:hypothetical protein
MSAQGGGRAGVAARKERTGALRGARLRRVLWAGRGGSRGGVPARDERAEALDAAALVSGFLPGMVCIFPAKIFGGVRPRFFLGQRQLAAERLR